jgi:hypothetical protein
MLLGALLRKGYRVLLPFGPHPDYDLVLHDDGAFRTVQCKTGRIVKGTLTFRMFSVTGNGKKKRAYGDSVDFFGVFCPDNNQTYLVPSALLPRWQANLRITPPRSKNKFSVLWAKDFQL